MSRAETHLSVRWSKRENDLLFHHPGPKPDGHLLYGALCGERCRRSYDPEDPGGVTYDPSFVKELDARGYDITTLRFLKAKPTAPFMQRRFRRKASEWLRGKR